ncbi:hypothetical protein BS78_10G059600 [Paspalum vaginatum]|nr:hypothetical protein BS78_10G059600 [Paspalum vaginatum]
MSHNTDALYCYKRTAVVRASDDFFPRDPASHTTHIAAVAYNSVFLGEFMLPDWDMFHSLHPAGEYHGSARAISGGPVYVSDAPREARLRAAEEDGLAGRLRAARASAWPADQGLPVHRPGTRRCQVAVFAALLVCCLLKIWNMNKFTGVLGVYNCQGPAWSFAEKKTVFHPTGADADALTCGVKGSDVHLIPEAATDTEWNGDCAVYRDARGDLVVLLDGSVLPVSLKVLEQDILTVSPIKELAPGFRFAPIGLVDMFNSGAAVEGLTYHLLDGARMIGDDGSAISAGAVGLVCMEVRGCGRFGAYSSVRPSKCTLGSAPVEFAYDSSAGLVVVELEAMRKERAHKIVFEL